MKKRKQQKYVYLHESEGKARKILLQQSVSSMLKVGCFKEGNRLLYNSTYSLFSNNFPSRKITFQLMTGP